MVWPPGVTIWIGGSDTHHVMLADAAPEPAIASGPASKLPNAKFLTFIGLRSLLPLLPLLRAEPVTETANCLDQPRTPVLFQLLPDARDVHLERVGFRTRRHGPHRFRQLRVSDELAAASHQGGQNAELDAGETELAVAAGGATFAEIDDDIARGQTGTTFTAMAPDHSLDAGHQLFECERLGDVIVRAELQPGDAVADGGARADSNQRGVSLRPEGLEQLGAFVIGQHQVEKHDVAVPIALSAPSAATLWVWSPDATDIQSRVSRLANSYGVILLN